MKREVQTLNLIFQNRQHHLKSENIIQKRHLILMNL